MKQRFVWILLAVLVALFTGTVAWAQEPAPQPGHQPGQPAQQPGQAAEPATPPVNPAETADFQAIYDLPKTDVDRTIELCEAFLGKYPESRYREEIYARLANAYFGKGDVDKMYVAGEKAIALNPNNVDVMSLIVYAVPRRISPNDLDAQQKLDTVEKYSHQILEQVSSMTKPAHLTEEVFAQAKNQKLAMAHSGLAMVNYHRQNIPEMAAQLEQATQLTSSPDPTDFYLLGIAYQQMKRYSDAATAFGKCADSPWAWQDRCKQSKGQAEKLAAAPPK